MSHLRVNDVILNLLFLLIKYIALFALQKNSNFTRLQTILIFNYIKTIISSDIHDQRRTS